MCRDFEGGGKKKNRNSDLNLQKIMSVKCVHFVFNVCSLKHDSMDTSHFYTKCTYEVPEKS